MWKGGVCKVVVPRKGSDEVIQQEREKPTSFRVKTYNVIQCDTRTDPRTQVYNLGLARAIKKQQHIITYKV